MITEKFNIKVAGADAFLLCNKFNAFDCLTFINFIVSLLPENDVSFSFSKKGATAIINNIMDSGNSIGFTQEEIEGLKEMALSDYFGNLFKLAYSNTSKDNQIKITDELLKLFTYNNAPIDKSMWTLLFPKANVLFSALLHAFRYNYNDFFMIDEY